MQGSTDSITSHDGWMLYGANGYTGVLIAAEAAGRGLRPVLAGRRADAVAAVAGRHGLGHRIFPLETPESIAAELRGAGVRAVLLAAGPFSTTSAAVVEACLQEGIHYLDITGEIGVFEACARRGPEAKARGVVLLPGAGFDVVPSDCLAATLAAALPGARELELAFASRGTSSKGTTKTAIEGLGRGGAIRRDGRIEQVPTAWKTREVPFRDRPRRCVSIPWGDVSTAYHSTGIPNIVVYLGLPPPLARTLRLLKPVLPLTRARAVQRLLKAWVDRTVRGPDEDMRRTVRVHLWGRVADASGRERTATLETPEGYRLTAATAVEATRRILDGGIDAGFQTPSRAFGAGFIEEFEGCDLRLD